MKPARKRKCKAYHGDVRCNKDFAPAFQQQQWCGDDCRDIIIKAKLERVRAKNEAKAKREARESQKAAREAHRKRKRDLKPISWFHNKARKACNEYIRYRDKAETCCSCDKVLAFEDKYDAGHYMPQGNNKHIAYDETNISGQCVECNQHKSGNQAKHRATLIDRWGEEAVINLEAKPPQGEKSYTREELLEIEKYYKAKLKELKTTD